MLNSSAPQIHTLITSTEKLGAKVPQDITEAYSEYEKIKAGIHTIYVRGEALTVATYDALMNDRDPAADPEVQRILASHQVGIEANLMQVRAIALDRLVTAVRLCAVDLIEAWREPFDKAAETIAEAYKHLGGIELANAEAILRKGGDAADWWAKGSQADQTIDTIVNAWTMLALQSGFVNENRNNHMLKFTDPTLAQWREHEMSGLRIKAWEAHGLGLPLSLADANEYIARAQRHASLIEQEQQAERHNRSGKRSAREIAFMNLGSLL